jgi:hypothetical protein
MFEVRLKFDSISVCSIAVIGNLPLPCKTEGPTDPILITCYDPSHIDSIRIDILPTTIGKS